MMTKEEILNEIKLCLLDNNSTYTKVEKAYNIACELHKTQVRKDGTPYIIHPLEVALILAKKGFGENCICGAILHDTVEDCGYTLDEIEREFGTSVRNMVDTVSEIKEENFDVMVERKKSLYVNKEFMHISVDEKTFKKLIADGKKHPLAFYIKFADRLHNLRTIKNFPYPKQIEKVKETEEWIIPVAITLKSNYFYRELTNECFKIKNKDQYDDFLSIYNYSLETSERNFKFLIKTFKEHFFQYSDKIKIYNDNVKEFEVFNSLKEKKLLKNLDNISENQIDIIPLYNIYVVEPSSVKEKRFNFIFKNQFYPLLKLVGYNVDSMTKIPYLIVQDKSRVLYKIFHVSDIEYRNFTIGESDNLVNIDDRNTHNLPIRKITVMDCNKDNAYSIAENSTVLDFALFLDDKVGLCFDYAEIIPAEKPKTKKDGDKKPNRLIKHAPYKVLSDGDTVIIHYKTDNNGNFIPNAKIRWIAYANTESAKLILVNHFETLYEK